MVSGGKGVTYTGAYIFDGCKLLKRIPNFPKVKDWLEYSFAGTSIQNVVIPKSVQVGAQGQFYGCKKLKKVVLEDTWRICIAMFYKSSVREVKIVTGPKIISRDAFAGCKKLKKVHLPNTVNRIEKESFKDCKSIRNLRIPASVRYINKYAFRGCSKKLTLYCKKNSTAHKFAKKHNMKYKLV